MPSSSSTTPASCELYDLVIDMDWDAVALHAKKHPQDAAWEDGEWHETPLYCACQNSPSEQAIRALLQAYPPAAQMGSKNGDLPLHIACRWRASVGVIRALLEYAPTTACVATKYGKTPLVALWEGYKTSNGEQEVYQCTCEKSILLMEAIAHFHGFLLEDGEPFCLFAAMKMECPDAPLYLVLEEYKHQISMCDKQKRLPLHVAVDVGIPSRRKLHKCVFEHLLERYPEAATIPDPVTGRLPLHTMVCNPAYSWKEIEVVFQSYPRAMAARDPLTGLLPFLLAPSVETCFCLLTAQPHALACWSPLTSYQVHQPVRSKMHVMVSHTIAVGLVAAALAGLSIAAATMS